VPNWEVPDLAFPDRNVAVQNRRLFLQPTNRTGVRWLSSLLGCSVRGSRVREKGKTVPEAQAVNINHSRQLLMAKAGQSSGSGKTGLGKQTIT